MLSSRTWACASELQGKRLLLLPLLVPPITFGIPLATVLYRAGLAGPMLGVGPARLVPAVPFVIIVPRFGKPTQIVGQAKGEVRA